MAEVLVRIATTLGALVVVAVLAVQLHAHDLLANAAQLTVQPKPAPAAVDAQLKDLKTVDDLRPGSQGALAAAALDLRIGRYAAAAGDARRAAKRDPKNFSAWVTLAVALGSTGDKAGQRAAFAKAHTLNPRYPIPR